MTKLLMLVLLVLPVRLAQASCLELQPTVTLSPEFQRAASPSCPLEVRLTVTNQDSTECAPRTFALAVGIGEGSAHAVLDQAYATLAPSETTTVEAAVLASEPTYGYLIGSATKPRGLFSSHVTTYASTLATYTFAQGCGCDQGYQLRDADDAAGKR